MKKYRCVVGSESGTKSELVKTALDEDELLRSFEGGGITLISYRQISESGKPRLKRRISAETVLSFTENMAALLRAGLSVQESLEVCARIMKKTQAEKLCLELHRSLLNGEAFYASLTLFSPSFSVLYVSLVKLGESTGSVEKVFTRLASYLRDKKQMRRKIVQSLLYPVTVCVTACAVCIFIALYVFPRIRDVFEVFSVGNMQAARQIQDMYASFGGTLVSLVVVLLLPFVFAVCRSLFPFVSYAVDKLLLNAPVLGKITRAFNTNDFAFAMELLCSSGIPAARALTQAAEVVGNSAFREGILSVAEAVSHGDTLSYSCDRAGVFPPYVVSWVSIGEQTGNVAQIFAQIHRYFEQENTHLLGSALAATEPAFILIAGVLLLILVSRFVLPVFSLMSGM